MKKGYVPELRFPEFRDKSGWVESDLGGLSQVLRGGSPRPIDSYLTEAANGLNWLKIGDVDKDSKYVTQTKEKVNHHALSKTRVVNPGDLILSNSMSFGRPYILKIKSCIHDGWIAITKISNKIKRDYLYYLISAPESQRFFINNAAGSGVQNLNADIIKSLPIFFPVNDIEQQKIADCLSSLDNVISLQTQKIDALQQYKKGLVQKLFPTEGGTVPELRFNEFKNEGEWEERKLSEICERIMDGTHFSPKSKSGKYIYVTSKNIKNGRLDLSDISYISDAEHKEIYKKCPVKKNDVLLTKDGANTGNCTINNVDFEFSLLSSVAVLRGSSIWLTQCFLYQLINSEKFQKTIRDSISGQAITRITLAKIGSYSVLIPKIAEQQKIADCLSSLDGLITDETQKLAVLKNHKTGLMQQLFPAMDEVNA